jgi:N-carbamoyl-L-amino-acid hydrolase
MAANSTARFAPSMLVSGAGHDACYISLVAPTSMIFVPCAAVINVILFH